MILEDPAKVIKKPESWLGTRHIIVFLCFTINWVMYAMRTNLSVGIVAMTDPKSSPNPDIPTFDWNDKSTILSSFYWGYILPQVFAGALSTKYGSRWILMLTILINSICCLLIPIIAVNLESKGIMALRVVQGLAQGFLYPPIHNILGRWVPHQERSSLGTFVYSGAPFGTVVGMMVTGLISASWVGWPISFYGFGVLGLICAVIWFWIGHDSPGNCGFTSEEETKYIEANLPPKCDQSLPIPWKDILTSLPVWAIVVANVGFAWGYANLLLQIPTYMSKIMKYDIQNNGFLSSAPYLVFWLLGFITGPSSDYLVNKGYMSRGTMRKCYNSIGTYVPAMALLTLGYLPEDQHGITIFLLIVAVGVNAACFSGFLVNHIDLASNYAGLLLGITNCIGNVFAMIAPLVVQAVVYDETDKYLWRIIFIISTCVYLVTSTFYVFFASGSTQKWNNIN